MINELEKEIVNQAMENIKKIFDVCVKFDAYSKSYYDGVVQLSSFQFACVVKLKVTDYNINEVIKECTWITKESNMPVLLLTSELPNRQLTILHENGIQAMDVAGNCYVQYQSLMMFCQGRKNSNLLIKDTLSFKEPGLKLLYFILKDLKHVNLPFRDIQSQTGVGLATINKLFSSLKQNGYLFTSKNGRYLKNTMSLLSIFVDNYCRVMKPKNLMASMKFTIKGINWIDIILPSGMEWGGEPAAFIKEKYLLPEEFEVYSSIDSMQLITAGIAVPARDGEIKVYRKFWIDEGTQQTAPSLIIYADLMGSGDSRCIETAQRIFDHELSYLR